MKLNSFCTANEMKYSIPSSYSFDLRSFESQQRSISLAHVKLIPKLKHLKLSKPILEMKTILIDKIFLRTKYLNKSILMILLKY